MAEVPNKTSEDDVKAESEDKLQGEMERPATARRRRFVRKRQQAGKFEEAKPLPSESSTHECEGGSGHKERTSEGFATSTSSQTGR